MKCPSCQTDHKRKYGLTCSCGYQFTFDPKSYGTAGFTDGKFTAAMRRAASNGNPFFTENQLYAAHVRSIKSTRMGAFVAAFFILGVALIVFLNSRGAGLFIFGIGMLFLTFAYFYRPRVMPQKKFAGLIKQWERTGKDIPGLIREPSLHTPPPTWQEDDIYDYGVERILIVQRDILVDVLVRNEIHTEQRMLVMSETGYPNYLIEIANRLLQERPDLPVFLLHDASEEGVQMRRRIANLDWLKVDASRVIDVGFTPKDFDKIKSATFLNYSGNDHRLPADALLCHQLLPGMAYCFDNGVRYEEFLQQRETESGGSFG